MGRPRYIYGAILLGLLLCIGAGSYFIAPVRQSNAQTADSELIKQRRAELEAELAKLESLIAQQQTLLQSTQGERRTLEGELNAIDAKIEKARLEIRRRRLAIDELQDDIFDKEVTVLELTEKLDREKESMGELIRRTAEIDDLSLVELVLSGKSFSEFFEELDDFQAVKVALQASFEELEVLRDANENAITALQGRKQSEEELKQLQELQESKLAAQEDEKAHILRVTKGEEARYQQMITANEQSAAQIRSELFELRGSAAINLGDAIEFANFASAKTGVRPAFVLGVLKQETRLGEFLGNGVWTEDMHPTRDRPVFRVIAQTLGVDPSSVPVSAAPSYGWGGAMGPAQFIPSTWACYGGYINVPTGSCSNRSGMDRDAFYAGPWSYNVNQDRLRALRGKQSPSNPWDNQDAFLASAVFMMDLGAARGGYAAEREAALRYFAGGNWQNPSYAFYADGVLEHASYFQRQIDTLKRLSE